MITLAALAVPMIGVAVLVARSGWSTADARVDAWQIEGPACGPGSSPVVGDPRRPARSFELQGVRFTRLNGNVSCVSLPVGGRFSKATELVCQFSSPGMLEVSKDGARQAYAPGWGRPATIRVRDGEPSCVVAGWFR
ncbi:hypothetical protein [Phenylobacterium deserti]|uniref:Uncharacterized protein n=1 Tax=Phenylobacterium deserti TaxID=1914756 RepID=A0A328AU92_9CAUL|nr:hypothetical protein [Phenylobacterium deserti]RAK57835.1 hypothetical protein DJ018_07950 [Phenylobacterium deserti]